MTLNPVCENVETAQGVPLTVTGVAQVKIMKNADLLQTASEQFLGKKEHEIKSTVLQTLEGHLRAILGKPNVYSSKKKVKKKSSMVFFQFIKLKKMCNGSIITLEEGFRLLQRHHKIFKAEFLWLFSNHNSCANAISMPSMPSRPK